MTAQQYRARKRFGQHFLVDSAVRDRIVAVFAPACGQRIVEIGPGRGALTDALVEALADADANAEKKTRITAVELDRDLAQHLAQRMARRHPPERFEVIQADILDVDLRDIAADDPSALRLIGNLPYNISTPLIFRLLEQVAHIHDMLFMLQKEVATRLAAAPGNKNYGRLSVMTTLALDCELLFDVPPQAFEPPPKVNSSVVRLTPKKHPLMPRDRALFDAVVATAFSQRRKTLRNSLAGLVQPGHFIQAGIDLTLRAEALSAEEYVALADAMAG